MSDMEHDMKKIHQDVSLIMFNNLNQDLLFLKTKFQSLEIKLNLFFMKVKKDVRISLIFHIRSLCQMVV